MLCSSGAFLEPCLDLFEVKSDVLPELEMGDGIGCVLAGSVVDKRDRDSEQASELLGIEKVVQRGVLLGGWDGNAGNEQGESVLKLCSGEESRVSNQGLGMARWVPSPKFSLT